MGSFKLGKMTLRSLFGTPETTCYPAVEKPAPAGLKGQIQNDIETCILCGICSKNCPAHALAVDKKVGTWQINRFCCVQCGTCVRLCPKNCLTMDPSRVQVSTKMEPVVLVKPQESEEEKAAKEAAKKAKIEAAMKAKEQREGK